MFPTGMWRGIYPPSTKTYCMVWLFHDKSRNKSVRADKAVLILASLGLDTGVDSELINDGAQVMKTLFWASAGVQNQARNGYL